MKKILLQMILLLIGCQLISQPIHYDSLDINNITARIYADNMNFWDREGSSKYFVKHDGGSLSTMFNQVIHIGGEDSIGGVHLSTDLYGQGDNSFQLGPISNNYIGNAVSWNRVYKINRSTIDSFISFIGTPNYIVPDIIKNWPAHGDVANGEARDLAPFHDVNLNGVYEYYLGDYPLIKGDQAIFYIINDDTIHNGSVQRLGVEVQVMVYGYNVDCDSGSVLNNTLFVDYKIINRSHNTYYNTFVESFSDIDVGYSANDKIGSDVQRGTYFGYNNENSTQDSIKAAQAVIVLSGPYMDPDGIDNPKFDTNAIQLCDESINGTNFGDSIIDNERFGLTRFIGGSSQNYFSGTTYSSPEVYYRLMTGEQEFYYGNYGMAYDSSNLPQIPCRYMYPGLSDSCFWGTGGIIPPNGQNWIHIDTSSAFFISDVRARGVSGGFTFKPNQTVELNLAFVTAFSDTGTVMIAVPELKQAIDSVRHFYFGGTYPCGGGFLDVESMYDTTDVIDFEIFPNPSTSNISLKYDSKLFGSDYYIYNITGSKIKEGKINNSNLTVIPLDNITSGVYIIRLTNSKFTNSKKFIIRK
jgi:hypothetical protein